MKSKPSKTISMYVLMVGVMTLLVVGSLVMFQIYSALTKSQITAVQQKAIKPLDGNIKNEVVTNLVGRRWFNRLELDNPIVINPPVATETGKVEEE
ncbi:hypothetical protein KKG65_01995 [Patescibacteria group bacterium]|nr:hypothetical protein [Patescibacteria group bacterium]